MADETFYVLVVHEKRFVAYSIENLLADSEFDIVANISDFRRIGEVVMDNDPDLCVVGDFGRETGAVCANLRSTFPLSKLALLDAGDTDELVRLAKAHRLDGCFSIDLTPELILSGLRLIAAGTRCIPQTAPCSIAADTEVFDKRPDVALTPREIAVVTLIGEGMANKVIARKLEIAESTVKAHLNSVLRKTGTSNRTQAARWVFEHGTEV